jgi:hypothetical protein
LDIDLEEKVSEIESSAKPAALDADIVLIKSAVTTIAMRFIFNSLVYRNYKATSTSEVAL